MMQIYFAAPVLSSGLRQSGAGGNCQHIAYCDCPWESLDDKGLCLQVAPNTVAASDQAGQLAQSVAQVSTFSAVSSQCHTVKPYASASVSSAPALKATYRLSLLATAEVWKTHDMNSA